MSQYMLKINTVSHNFLKVLTISYFRALWTNPRMSDHIQKKLLDKTVASMNVELPAKNHYNGSSKFFLRLSQNVFSRFSKYNFF